MRDYSEFSVRDEQKPRWLRVAALAVKQCGVVSLRQLLAVGFTYAEVRTLVNRGILIPLHRGVYAVAHRPLLTKGYLVAALLATGPDAFLSHRTATAVWGLGEVSARRIDVTVPGRKRRSRGSLRVHHTTMIDGVSTRNGLRVSSFPRMLVELAPIESQRELGRLITHGVRKGALDLDEMRRALDRHARSPGLGKLNAALAAYLPRADRKSKLERDFDEFLANHPEIPPPQTNVQIAGWEIDCYWPEQRLAVELDGRPYHIAVQDMEKDRYKDAKLLLIDVRTMRITDTRFEHDRPGVYRDLIAALRLRTPPAGG